MKLAFAVEGPDVFFLKTDLNTFFLGLRIVVKLSTVFCANRLTDLVTIRSILSDMALAIISLNPIRCLVLVSEMTSSSKSRL